MQQFPSEDGYLMLTIARNLALGFGMSTAEGTIPTNGTQPFVTFIWALGYLAVGADKFYGVIVSHLVQFVASCLFALVVYRLFLKVFKTHLYGNQIAIIGAALLFASPQLLPHSMNFLETGVYALVIAVVISTFYETDADAGNLWSYKKSIAVGLLLGLLFWVRIDSVFIIFAACVSYLYRGAHLGAAHLRERFVRTLVFGTTSVIVASPWLISNYLNFGSFMPISGQAQDAKSFAQNLVVIPSTLVEYLSIIVPIPQSLQQQPAVVAFCCLLIALAIVLWVMMFRKLNRGHRTLMIFGAIVAFCFAFYYGIFFGAKHFVARYLSVLAVFFAMFTITIAFHIWSMVGRAKLPSASIAGLVVVLLVAGLNVRIYFTGMPHEHIQVINWVEQNVPDDQWVAAIQTGTLGYFHDRTKNLDGKVNPDALAAKKGRAFCPEVDDETVFINGKKNCLMHYIVQSDIAYLADWQGITGWSEYEPLKSNFELVVNDSKSNLGVYRRYGAKTKAMVEK
jgi:hypothetical protein